MCNVFIIENVCVIKNRGGGAGRLSELSDFSAGLIFNERDRQGQGGASIFK